MKKPSDDVFQRVNEGSFRLNPAVQSFRLTRFHWRDAPQLILGLVGSLILLTGIHLAWAAVFTKGLLIDKDRPDRQEDFLQVAQEVQEVVSTSEALLQAIREDDQDAIRRCQKKLEENGERQKQLHEREAQRLVEHAIAENALRKRFGATAAGLTVAGLSLLYVSQSLFGRSRRHLAEPSDAADSR